MEGDGILAYTTNVPWLGEGVAMTEAAREHPVSIGARQAMDKASAYWPDLDVSKLARSKAVRSATGTAALVVEDENLSRPAFIAAATATGEAVTLAAISREAAGEPQLSRADIEYIKEFVRWIFDGFWERE